MLFIDIMIAILIVAIIFNLYFFRFEYKKKVVALWDKWSKNIFRKIQVKHKLSEHESCNDKESDISIKNNNKDKKVSENIDADSNNLPVLFYKPKVIYKNSYRVKNNTQARYHICATCGKIKFKK